MVGVTLKDFDAVAKTASHEPSCEFRLGGKVWHVKNQMDLPFILTQGTLNHHGFRPAPRPTPEDPEVCTNCGGERDDPVHRDTIEMTFSRLLVDDEVPAFVTMLRKPNSPITLGNYNEIMAFINTEVAKRPTERPASSAVTPRATGRRSRAASTSRVTPRKRSAASPSTPSST